MRSFLLPEHRCSCGKLLFKGILMLSQVEIKCRRCGRIQAIGQQYEDLAQNQYAFVAAIAEEDIYKENPSPHIVDMTDSAIKTLGFNHDELVGREVRSLDPLMASGAYGNLWKLIVERNFQPFSIEVYQPIKGGGFVKARSRTNFQRAKEGVYLLSIFDPIDVVEKISGNHDCVNSLSSGKVFCPYLMEINPAGICDSITYELASLLGYLITDIVNKPFIYLYPEYNIKDRNKLLKTMMENRQSYRLIGDVLIGKDGKKFVFDTCFTARYADNGVFNGYSLSLWSNDTKDYKSTLNFI